MKQIHCAVYCLRRYFVRVERYERLPEDFVGVFGAGDFP